MNRRSFFKRVTITATALALAPSFAIQEACEPCYYSSIQFLDQRDLLDIIFKKMPDYSVLDYMTRDSL